MRRSTATRCWQTLVQPATSDEGRAVRGFIAHVAADGLDQAYAALSEGRRAAVDRAAFADRLPEVFRCAEGFTVNGIHGATGRATCIDGWLKGVDQGAAYAFEVSDGPDGAKIVGWQTGSCPD